MAGLGTEAPAGDAASALIDGQFSIDFGSACPEFGGGQPAFVARSARTGPGFVAVQVQMGLPARARLLAALPAVPVPNMMVPLAHATAPMPSGEVGSFVICQCPLGRPLSADPRPWAEQELLDSLIRPAAYGLAELHRRDATHRAIRPTNLFRPGAGDPVMLGCAWASPPAFWQPCVYEPPYAAVCLPAGRGDGAWADDIYALGVVTVMLALGRDPMAGMTDDEIVQAKLDQGSFAALTAGHRLPTAIAELVRGMLADDPEHRPSATLLGDPAAARARRAAARPQRRAQRALTVGDASVWTTQGLALAVMGRPDQAAAQLRNGSVSQWLRRGLGDSALAGRIEEICLQRDGASPGEEPRADALLAARAVAVLDPLAPLSWRRLTLWPDGLGTALNHALSTDAAKAIALTEVAASEAALAFGMLRPERSDIAGLRNEARQIRSVLGARPPEQGALRLNYALNPLAPCESPLLAGHWVARLGDLLPALEAAAGGKQRGAPSPVDRHVVAFIGVRRDERTQSDLGQLANLAAPADPMSQLRLLARLQQYTHPDRLPALTAWMAAIVGEATEKYSSMTRRKQLAERLAELGQGGLLPPLAALLDDRAKLAQDKAGFQAAMLRSGEIDAALQSIDESIAPRRLAAVKAAHDVVNAVSLAVCGLALAAAVFL